MGEGEHFSAFRPLPGSGGSGAVPRSGSSISPPVMLAAEDLARRSIGDHFSSGFLTRFKPPWRAKVERPPAALNLNATIASGYASIAPSRRRTEFLDGDADILRSRESLLFDL